VHSNAHKKWGGEVVINCRKSCKYLYAPYVCMTSETKKRVLFKRRIRFFPAAQAHTSTSANCSNCARDADTYKLCVGIAFYITTHRHPTVSAHLETFYGSNQIQNKIIKFELNFSSYDARKQQNSTRHYCFHLYIYTYKY